MTAGRSVLIQREQHPGFCEGVDNAGMWIVAADTLAEAIFWARVLG